MADPQVEEGEGKPGEVQAVAVDDEESKKSDPDEIGKRSKRSRSRRRIRTSYFPKFACMKLEEDMDGNFDMEVEVDGQRPEPTHLVIMVNGLIGSAQNWRFAAKQFLKKYPRDVVVHRSECNPSMLTFDGVDVMGDRLADEVKLVIKRHPSVRKISFIGHSLGGLVCRYAIARLYDVDPVNELAQGNGESKNDGSSNHVQEVKSKPKIAGLEPVNFITSASPHLGSRGHRQVPVLCGFQTLEKLAARSSWVLGRTGRHLFLTDSEDGKPLLLQMVDDDKIKFISALKAFKRRVVYANASFDHLVGWSTSSLRRPNELPKREDLSRDSRHEKYEHIVNVETAASYEDFSEENKSGGGSTTNMEEKMLRELIKLGWERVDVSFSGSKQRFLAHSTIQVKNYCINSDGADVVQHMIDQFQL